MGQYIWLDLHTDLFISYSTLIIDFPYKIYIITFFLLIKEQFSIDQLYYFFWFDHYLFLIPFTNFFYLQIRLYLMHKQQGIQKQLATYQELVEFIFKNGGIVIANFYNSWCSPCKLIEPYLQLYQKQFQIAMAKIDTDKSQQLSTKYDIHAIPTFILLRKLNGEVSVVEEVVSAHPQKLKKLFESGYNLKNNKT